MTHSCHEPAIHSPPCPTIRFCARFGSFLLAWWLGHFAPVTWPIVLVDQPRASLVAYSFTIRVVPQLKAMAGAKEAAGQSGSSLKELLLVQPPEQLLSVLTNSSDIKIAVPCSALSKAARTSSSKVVVQVKGSTGSDLLLDCGTFWKGAPNHLVKMHYESLLDFANDDALRALTKKLQVQCPLELPTTVRLPSRTPAPKQDMVGPPALRTMARPQSAPLSRQPAVLDRAAEPASATVHTTLVLDSLLEGAASEDTKQPTENTICNAIVQGIPAGQRGSLEIGAASTVSCCAVPSALQCEDNKAGSTPSIETPFKSSGLSQASKGSPDSDGKSTGMGRSGSLMVEPYRPDVSKPPTAPRKSPRPSISASPLAAAAAAAAPADSSPALACRLDFISRALSLDDWVKGPAENEPVEQETFGWLSTHLPPRAATALSSIASRAMHAVAGTEQPATTCAQAVEFLQLSDSDSEESTTQQAVGTSGLPVQARYNSAASAGGRASSELGVDWQSSPPPTAKSASSDRFNHVFFPPWSIMSDAATQTGTAAGEQPHASTNSTRGLQSLAAATADPASAHFESFLQHFAAGLPHLAMAAADLHSVHGTSSSIFGQASFYLKTCLQIRDELSELMERHREHATE